MMKKTVSTALVALAGAVVLTLSACNTVKGAGEDITSVGEAGDDAINGN